MTLLLTDGSGKENKKIQPVFEFELVGLWPDQSVACEEKEVGLQLWFGANQREVLLHFSIIITIIIIFNPIWIPEKISLWRKSSQRPRPLSSERGAHGEVSPGVAPPSESEGLTLGVMFNACLGPRGRP